MVGDIYRLKYINQGYLLLDIFFLQLKRRPLLFISAVCSARRGTYRQSATAALFVYDLFVLVRVCRTNGYSAQLL